MLRKTDLNFEWKYRPDFHSSYIDSAFDDSTFETVHIPHTNIEVPYNNFDEKLYQFESCYRKKIWIDPLADDERVAIKFNGVMTYAKVYLNGEYVGEHIGGYTPVTLDITSFAKVNDYNQLVVYVDSTEREDIPPFGHVIDYLTYGGIYREVELIYYHEVSLEHVCIKTRDVLTDQASLDIDLYTKNLTNEQEHLTCQFELFFEGNSVKVFEHEIHLSEKSSEKLNVKELVSDIHLWDTDSPHLYELQLRLIKEERVIDKHDIRFGFREATFLPDGFYLNGKKIKIRGLNRHQSFPYVGYAMPKSAQYKDAEILKNELGVNTVRLSHYPQSDHFLNRCDELGLLVFDEIPGWQHIGDKEWQDRAVNHVREMIMKDFNHPSVIIWGVRINESQDNDEFYDRTNALAKELDDTRNTGGVRCIEKSNPIEDVYTYNDFVHKGDNVGLQKKKQVTKTEKPYLITEYNGHMFPTKKFDNETHRVEHALRHMNVVNAMEIDDDISGAIGWCMFDYNTHKDFGSGDKICYHGVMDMFRIPKPAAYVYASQQNHSPVMHVASSFNIGEFPGSMLQDVYVFTNCDYVKLYKNGNYINKFFPDKDSYTGVEHPPIIVDDFLGDLIEKNEPFTPADAKIVKKLLIKVSKTGGELGWLDKIKMAWIFLKYKMNTLDAEDLYTKYFGGWGAEATDYVFEGYIGDECVMKTTHSQVFQPKLVMNVDNDRLVEAETYDTTRIVLRLLDDDGNDIVYANDSVTIETEGPIEVIGPKVISLIGGSIAFWVKTSGNSGNGKIVVHSERFGQLEEKLTVKKES